MIHLRYHVDIAALCCGEVRHAEVVMRELGITYQDSHAIAMAEQWWFFDCSHVPEILPEYIVPLEQQHADLYLKL